MTNTTSTNGSSDHEQETILGHEKPAMSSETDSHEVQEGAGDDHAPEIARETASTHEEARASAEEFSSGEMVSEGGTDHSTQHETDEPSLAHAPQEAATAGPTAENPDQHEEIDDRPVDPITGEEMQQFFEQLIHAMDVRGQVRLRGEAADQVTLDIINCPDASLVIGRHGQTVDDLQYLGGLILNSRGRERRRFLLNVENYREKREEILRKSATDLARQVAEFGQEAVLDPLPPHERRIVHMALVDIPEVYTYSEGAEPDRRLVISPRKIGGGGQSLNETPRVTEDQSETEAAMGEAAHSHAPVENAAFGEGEIGSETEELYRDASEFGSANLSAGARTEDEPPSSSRVTDSELPETPPGGGAHAGHTGDESEH